MAPATSFKCALITGGAGGIGRALAEYFISQGKEGHHSWTDRVEASSTAKEIGAATYYVLNTGKTNDIESFTRKLLQEHPAVDCLVNNAGVQRPLEILKDGDFLEKADQEIDIDIRGPMHLTLALLPHLQTKPNATAINVSSVLGFVPFSVINPVYNGTKAWLHFWSINLRAQSQQAGADVKVVEIAPPTVATDLHREREDPDDNKKENNPDALSLDEFMEYVNEKMEAGEEMIAPGMAEGIVGTWYREFGEKASGK